MKRKRSYSKVTCRALSILGKSIRLGRMERGMTAQELANRAGISRSTLYKIEKGEPGPEVGTVFEVAVLVGVRLFGDDGPKLAMHEAQVETKLALLPQSVRPSAREVDDAF